MCRIICLFILTTISQYIYSQNFISENKLWSIVSEDSFESKWTRTTYYKFLGDTTIKQIKYHMLLSTENIELSDWLTDSFWRETNSKVYQFSAYTQSEQLIYDFELAKGDSFFLPEPQSFLIVDSVSTKEWGTSDRKLIYFRPDEITQSQTIWIEGVGQDGLITRSSDNGYIGAFVKILCYNENEDLIYKNPKYNSCYIRTSILNLTQKEDLVKCYISGYGIITIELLDCKKGIFHLYNTDGKKIGSKYIETNKSYYQTTCHGIYIYRFENEFGEIQSGKVVLQ